MESRASAPAPAPPARYIARADFIAVLPWGERRRVTLELGRPYRCGPDAGAEWGCAVAVNGLAGPIADVRGHDSLQALCLALSSALNVLRRHEAAGGRLLDLDSGGLIRWDDYLNLPE
jgi:hypothetical protein